MKQKIYGTFVVFKPSMTNTHLNAGRESVESAIGVDEAPLSRRMSLRDVNEAMLNPEILHQLKSV